MTCVSTLAASRKVKIGIELEELISACSLNRAWEGILGFEGAFFLYVRIPITSTGRESYRSNVNRARCRGERSAGEAVDRKGSIYHKPKFRERITLTLSSSSIAKTK